MSGASHPPSLIAIDGPAASGKGTLAKRLAHHYGFAHLDTGALYRAIALLVLRDGCDPTDETMALAMVPFLATVDLEAPDLRTLEVGAAASQVAAHTQVRRSLVDYQRGFAEKPPEGASGAVLEGRDIGTVICPHAPVKIFITASVPVRAKRRLGDLLRSGVPVDEATVRADIEERDRRDRERAEAPLRQAEDAVLLDTTDLSIEAAVCRACEIIASRADR